MSDGFRKPSIVEVVSNYTNLRQSGREWRGLCPFHSEKTPSFYVNEDKGVFHCYGCQESGDVITFIQKIEGVDFKGALGHLGLDGTPRAFKSRKSPERQAAEVIMAWAEQMSLLIGAKMRNLGQRGHIAKLVLSIEGVDRDFMHEEIENCGRQWTILEALDDDLAHLDFIPELWKQRRIVEGITSE